MMPCKAWLMSGHVSREYYLCVRDSGDGTERRLFTLADDFLQYLLVTVHRHWEEGSDGWFYIPGTGHFQLSQDMRWRRGTPPLKCFLDFDAEKGTASLDESKLVRVSDNLEYVELRPGTLPGRFTEYEPYTRHHSMKERALALQEFLSIAHTGMYVSHAMQASGVLQLHIARRSRVALLGSAATFFRDATPEEATDAMFSTCNLIQHAQCIPVNWDPETCLVVDNQGHPVILPLDFSGGLYALDTQAAYYYVLNALMQAYKSTRRDRGGGGGGGGWADLFRRFFSASPTAEVPNGRLLRVGYGTVAVDEYMRVLLAGGDADDLRYGLSGIEQLELASPGPVHHPAVGNLLVTREGKVGMLRGDMALRGGEEVSEYITRGLTSPRRAGTHVALRQRGYMRETYLEDFASIVSERYRERRTVPRWATPWVYATYAKYMASSGLVPLLEYVEHDRDRYTTLVLSPANDQPVLTAAEFNRAHGNDVGLWMQYYARIVVLYVNFAVARRIQFLSTHAEDILVFRPKVLVPARLTWTLVGQDCLPLHEYVNYLFYQAFRKLVGLAQIAHADVNGLNDLWDAFRGSLSQTGLLDAGHDNTLITDRPTWLQENARAGEILERERRLRHAPRQTRGRKPA